VKFRITVEGTSYEVEVETLDDNGHAQIAESRRAPIPAPSAPPRDAPPAPAPGAGALGADPKVIKSPVAGLVQSIAVKVGDTVGVNDTVLVLEAMKMESSVASPIAGKVRAIPVHEGQAVRMGDALVELE